jgi:hypothetical protein
MAKSLFVFSFSAVRYKFYKNHFLSYHLNGENVGERTKRLKIFFLTAKNREIPRIILVFSLMTLSLRQN